MRAPPRFKQADLTRALKAARDAGLVVNRFEIDRDGKIVIYTGPAAELPVEDAYEKWRAEHEGPRS